LSATSPPGAAPLATLACNGQPGVIKPGIDRFLYMATPAVGAVIELATDGLAVPLLEAVLGGLTWDLEHICGTPDPGDPGLGPADYAALADFTNIAVYGPALDRVVQWFTHMMWPQWCNCTNGPPPPNSTTTLLPPQGTNTGAPGGASGATCWTGSTTRTYVAGAGSLPNYTAALWDDGTNLAVRQNVRHPIPNTSLLRLSGTWTPEPPDDTLGIFLVVDFYDVNGQLISGFFYPPSGQHSLSGSCEGPIPAGTVDVNFTLNISYDGIHDNLNGTAPYQVDVFCGSQGPGTPEVPCCPPDPSVDIRLTQIQQTLTYLVNQFSTAAPPAQYTRGNSHVGLTGTGTLTVSGLFGILIEVTQGVPTVPQLPGVPPYQWSVGWTSVLTGDGMIDEQRVTRQAQIWASRLAPYATQIGYQFNAGFEATITELLPA